MATIDTGNIFWEQQSGTVKSNDTNYDGVVYEDAGDRGSLGQEDFLTIFVEQLKTQDPLNPENSTDMTTQVTNFSQLDEMQAMNKGIETMASAFGQKNQYDELSQASDFVGKSVVYDVSSLEITSGSVSKDIQFSMDKTANTATLTIFDAEGNVVDQQAIVASEGDNTYAWDGTSAGVALPDGDYFFRVQAFDSEGKDISPLVVQEAVIATVSVDALGKTVFKLGDGSTITQEDIVGLNGVNSSEMNALASINKQLALLLQSAQTGSALDITDVESLVGHTVRFQSSLIQLNGQSEVEIDYSLSQDTESMLLTVFDAAGNVVSKREIAGEDAGIGTYHWSTTDDDGKPLESANYYYSITGINSEGEEISVTTYDEKKVIAAEIVNGVAYYQLEDDSIVTSESIFGIVPQEQVNTGDYSSLSDAASLLGKDISYAGSSYLYDGVAADPFVYELADNAKEVTITIRDNEGTIIKKVAIGAQPEGRNAYTWNGKDEDGNKVATGKYTYHIDAADSDGATVSANQFTNANVLSVEMISGLVYFTLSSGETITSDKINGVAV